MEGEKRQNPRVFAVADVDFEHQGMRYHGRINDMSQGGIYIDTINPLPQGSSLTFEFWLPGDESGDPIPGEGRVAWMAHMQGMGICFTRLSDENLGRLKAYLTRT